MTDYTARNVLLKDANGNYLIPYTEKADLSLSNLNASGKAYVAIKGYDSTATYSLNEVVMTIVSGSVLFYKSLANNNTSALSDTTKWEAVSFGGGSPAWGNITGTLSNQTDLQNVLDGKANTDLSNLSTTGEEHFANPALTNSPYTTNRILEIPQDIKLELSNGTLTLEAGSKVYVPNGFEADGITPHFDVVTIETDIVNGNSHDGYHENFWLSSARNYLFTYGDTANFSGPTQPTGFGPYAVWYDTANNIIKNTGDGGSTWYSGLSLPICRAVGGASNTVTSIDQIFNGFGYIGSTVFALPMKGEATTAINQNGTVTKTIWESTTVQTANVSASSEYSMSSSGVLTAGFNEVGYTKLADVTYYDSRIQNVNFYDIGFVANTNASNLSKAGRSYLSGLGMPDITKGYLVSNSFASSTNFNAPCNGYFFFRATWKTAGRILVFLASINGSSFYKPYAGGYFYCDTYGIAQNVWLPVKKGNKVQAQYNSNTDITEGLWFIPAEGEN